MTAPTLVSTGVILIVVVTIAYGGTFLLRVVSGAVPTNGLQQTYFRAGHAHAGVLIILGLVVRILMTMSPVPGWSRSLADLVLYAALFVSAGFFLSVIGRDPQAPNRLRVLIGVGFVLLAVGLVGAGAGLVVAGLRAG